MSRRRLVLFRCRGEWVAQDSDPEVRRLFGTDVLPTAFLATAEREDVVAEVRAANPDADVSVHDGPACPACDRPSAWRDTATGRSRLCVRCAP